MSPKITKSLENWIVFLVSVSILLICIIYIFIHPNKRDSGTILLTLLSLACGVATMFVTGKFYAEGTIKLITFRSGGAIGIFIFLFFFLVVNKKTENCSVLTEFKTDIMVFKTDLSNKISQLETERNNEKNLEKKEKMGTDINRKKTSIENIEMLLIPHITDAISTCNNDNFDAQIYQQLKEEFNSYKH